MNTNLEQPDTFLKIGDIWNMCVYAPAMIGYLM